MKHLKFDIALESDETSLFVTPAPPDENEVYNVILEQNEELASIEEATAALESIAEKLRSGMSKSIALEAHVSCPSLADAVRYSTLTMSPSLEGLVPALEALGEDREGLLARVIAAIVSTYKKFIAWVLKKYKEISQSKFFDYFRKNKAGDKATEYGAKAAKDNTAAAKAAASVVSTDAREDVHDRVIDVLEKLSAKYATALAEINNKPSLILVVNNPEVVNSLFKKVETWLPVLDSATGVQKGMTDAISKTNSGGSADGYVARVNELTDKFLEPLPSEEDMAKEKLIMPAEGSGKIDLASLDIAKLCKDFSTIVLGNHFIANIGNHTRRFEALSKALTDFELLLGRKRFPKSYSGEQRNSCIKATKQTLSALSKYLNYAMMDMSAAASVYDSVQVLGGRLTSLKMSTTAAIKEIITNTVDDGDKEALKEFYLKVSGFDIDGVQ